MSITYNLLFFQDSQWNRRDHVLWHFSFKWSNQELWCIKKITSPPRRSEVVKSKMETENINSFIGKILKQNGQRSTIPTWQVWLDSKGNGRRREVQQAQGWVLASWYVFSASGIFETLRWQLLTASLGKHQSHSFIPSNSHCCMWCWNAVYGVCLSFRLDILYFTLWN